MAALGRVCSLKNILLGTYFDFKKSRQMAELHKITLFMLLIERQKSRDLLPGMGSTVTPIAFPTFVLDATLLLFWEMALIIWSFLLLLLLFKLLLTLAMMLNVRRMNAIKLKLLIP